MASIKQVYLVHPNSPLIYRDKKKNKIQNHQQTDRDIILSPVNPATKHHIIVYMVHAQNPRQPLSPLQYSPHPQPNCLARGRGSKPINPETKKPTHNLLKYIERNHRPRCILQMTRKQAQWIPTQTQKG